LKIEKNWLPDSKLSNTKLRNAKAMTEMRSMLRKMTFFPAYFADKVVFMIIRREDKFQSF